MFLPEKKKHSLGHPTVQEASEHAGMEERGTHVE
jgi:hypothetical protein